MKSLSHFLLTASPCQKEEIKRQTVSRKVTSCVLQEHACFSGATHSTDFYDIIHHSSTRSSWHFRILGEHSDGADRGAHLSWLKLQCKLLYSTLCVCVGFKSHGKLGSSVLVVARCENLCVFIFSSHLGLILISATRGFALHPQGQIY